MTDKQIIVDVTQCPYYREGKFCVYLSYKTKCEGNCIWTSYKEMEEQLKRKEQECEMWKNLTVDNGAVALNYQKTIDQLKEQLEAYKMEAEEGKEINAELKAENETLKSFDINLVGVKECEIKELLKLKQTLTEIKEIVKEQLPTVNYNFAKSMHPEMFNCYEQILQKISECEV